MKRVILLGDFHNGSGSGLTTKPANPIQEQLLDRYKDCIKTLRARPDVLIVNGDAVDGEQLRGRGAMDNPDMNHQIEDACELVRMWKPKKVYLVSGTQYHVSVGSVDGERMMAGQLLDLGAEWTRKLHLEVNGWFRLQCRHHIGSSGIPHGRFTPQNRSSVWNALNAAARGGTPDHLCAYSHVHYWTYSESFLGAVMTLPAWQAVGSRYGDERCDGHVDLGAVSLQIGDTEEQGWSWDKRLYHASVVDRTVRI